MEISCSFQSTVSRPFGFDRKDRKKNTRALPLLACQKEISAHKSSFKFTGIENELELILSRAAVFTLPEEGSPKTGTGTRGREVGMRDQDAIHNFHGKKSACTTLNTPVY